MESSYARGIYIMTTLKPLGAYSSTAELYREAKEMILALEAEIDALMLEYCPEEMSPEQMENWARHQKPVPEDFQDER